MLRNTAVVTALASVGLASIASAAVVDLTSAGSFGTIGGARFETSDFRSAGTGVIDPFVRIQHNGTEQGYNTSGRPVPFDELNAANFTHDLTYGAIPTRTINGVDYKEFLLDINQVNSGTNSLLSLDKVQIYTSATGGATTTNVSTLGTLRYDIDAGGDNWVKLDYNLGSGSGQGDMRMFIPVSAFAGATANTFVYLYSMFGINWASNDGFEEWAIQNATGVVPVPSAVWAGGSCLLGLAGFSAVRRRMAR